MFNLHHKYGMNDIPVVHTVCLSSAQTKLHSCCDSVSSHDYTFRLLTTSSGGTRFLAPRAGNHNGRP